MTLPLLYANPAPMQKFLVPPEQDSYAVDEGVGFIEVKLDGGASRYRKDFIGAARVVTVKWVFNRNEYLYFRSFFNTTIDMGSLPFLLDLILDEPSPVEHRVHFQQDSVKLSAQSGLSYTVTATLEALPFLPNAALDLERVAAYEADPCGSDLEAIEPNPSDPPTTDGVTPDQNNNTGDTVNLDSSTYFDAQGGPALTYVATNLPDGLTIDPVTGIITGTITSGTSSLSSTVTATNSIGAAQQRFTWLVIGVGQP